MHKNVTSFGVCRDASWINTGSLSCVAHTIPMCTSIDHHKNCDQFQRNCAYGKHENVPLKFFDNDTDVLALMKGT